MNRFNVLKYEFGSSLKSSLIWAVSLSAFIVMIIGIFTALGEDLQLFSDIIADFPPEYQAILGINPESMTSMVSLIAIYLPFLRLSVAIQAAILGLKMLTYEESQRTADFLLTKPISRNKIFISKLIASLLSIIITISIFTIVAILGYLMAEKRANYEVGLLIKIMVSMLFTALFVFGFTLILSQLMKKVKGYIGMAIGLEIGFFFLSTLKTIMKVEWLGYINPYSYFTASNIIVDNGYDIVLTIISFLVTTLTIVLSLVLYNRRDINQVS